MIGEFRVFKREENGFDGFQRSRVGFPLDLVIGDLVCAGKGPGILNLGIRVHVGLGKAHIFADGVRQIVVHDRVGEIGVGTEIRQWIIPFELVGGDIEQRIGRRVGGEAQGVAFIARP